MNDSKVPSAFQPGGSLAHSDPSPSALRRRQARTGLRKVLISAAALTLLGLLYWNASHRGSTSLPGTRPAVSMFSWSTRCPPPEQGNEAIQCHIERARENFEHFLLRQSKTPEEAVRTFVEQYKRQPPSGFEGWARFALQNRAAVIDDFGQLEADLASFKHLASRLHRQRMAGARKLALPGLSYWSVKGGQLTTDTNPGSEPARQLRALIEPLLDKLPDVEFLFRDDDDAAPHVCGPNKGREGDEAAKAQLKGSTSGDATWESVRGRCRENVLTHSSTTDDRPKLDICPRRPSDPFKDLHSAFFSRFDCLNVTLPVLSASKLSPLQDVLIHNPCHAAAQAGKRDEVRYEDKKPVLFWRGEASGFHDDAKSWWKGHRQHAVLMAHRYREQAARILAGQEDTAVAEVPGTPSSFTEDQLRALTGLGPEHFDVAFSASGAECKKHAASCDRLRAVAPFRPSAGGIDEALQHRLVLDLDGPRSSSCDFYKLLGSNSVVFKQTALAEHHDDRIIPWLHYVPVSLEMTELPQLVDFFINDPNGVELGGAIARAGREWAQSALRPVDIQISLYRVLLDVARLLA